MRVRRLAGSGDAILDQSSVNRESRPSKSRRGRGGAPGFRSYTPRVNEKYIALAVPFFFLAIAIELALTHRQRKTDPRYRFADSITNLSCGTGQQVIAPFLKALTLAGYFFLYEHARVFSISPTSVVGWVVLLFGVDLGYYFFHRASHRVNIIWAGHVVHHQSEEYNLSVALRQSWFVKLAEWIFYLPLAVAAFPPEMFLAMTTFNTLYQFWIHTRGIGKLGPLEWIMNTPSHHRVHHGIDPKYIDKNYAGVFIIWDRMFGTFREEDTEPVYGIVKPLASFNPLWANVEYFVEMWRLAGRCDSWMDKLKVVFAPPDWRPASLGGTVTIPETSRATQPKYDVQAPRGLAAYVGINFALVGAATTAMLAIQATAPLGDLAVATAVVLATLIAWGALFDGKRWALGFEIARLAAATAALAWLTRDHAHATAIAVGAAAAAVGLAVWVAQYRQHFGGARETVTA